jgi:tRNA pseudouridine55 synthase
VNGFLNVNKPRGLSSRAVVDAVNRTLRELGFPRGKLPKVGHAGTLDPLATGVLVVGLGSATRLMELVQSRSKTYRATFLLGRRSDTDDVAGSVVDGDHSRATQITRAELDGVLKDFRGRIEQVPPAYSAVHVEGRRAYQLARQGEAMTLQPRLVEVHRLDVLRFDPPTVSLEIECGSGTYIRSIGRDLGDRLQCGAVLSELIRTRIGPFMLDDALPLRELSAESLKARLQPCVVATQHLPRYACDECEAERLSYGRGIVPRPESWQTEPAESGRPFALIDASGSLLAVGDWSRDTLELRPSINLNAAQGPRRSANEA